MGDVVLATTKMNRIVDVQPGRITVEPGVTVAAIQERLTEAGAWFPPVPTFTGACAGGIVATNAAGAATFKYGSTRDWVEALTVVLADGTVLDVARGMSQAHEGRFDIETTRGRVRVSVPTYEMPKVAKRSAGYHAAPDMDLDRSLHWIRRHARGCDTHHVPHLDPGAEYRASPGSRARVKQPHSSSWGRCGRRRSTTWRTRDDAGIDVCAIEHMDRRSLEIVREDGADRRNNVAVPGRNCARPARTARAASRRSMPPVPSSRFRNRLEVPRPTTRSAHSADCSTATACSTETELALPGDRRRDAELLAVREAVPAGVNQRISTAKRTIDERIEKTAGDMVVPFERCGEMMDVYRRGFESRGLDYAIWGHLSDGNVHPNVIARSYDDVVRGKEAMLEFGRHVARLGGCPLAEHGVGRNPVKQALLAQLYGQAGIDEMRAVKQALDPDNRLAPGVIFSVP